MVAASITLVDVRVIQPDEVLVPPRDGRKIVYSGDTRSIEEMIAFADHADALIHEATFDHSLADIAYHYGHSTVTEAATIAKEAQVKKLYITHVSPRYLDPKDLYKEAHKVFKKVIIPRDFQTFAVPLGK
jgi:ribonuclease Z